MSLSDNHTNSDSEALQEWSFSVIGFRFYRFCRFYRITRKQKKFKMLPHWEVNPDSSDISDFQVRHAFEP